MENKAKRFIIVTGTRPCFMKSLPLAQEMEKQGIRYDIFNPGQHYDFEMSRIFEEELGAKNIYHGERKEDNPIKNIQEMIRQFDAYIQTVGDLAGVFVVGDVNASLACALVAHKRGIPVIHIEAGLRSFDISMPEELNRIMIDHVSDILLAHCQDAVDNLAAEDLTDHVYMVGNLGIDALCKILPKTSGEKVGREFILVTIHRLENLNHPERLRRILGELDLIAEKFEVLFPVHPHTKKKLEEDPSLNPIRVSFIKPMGYLHFINLIRKAMMVITDSGGVQEETTYLGIPCLTVRDNTERPITIFEGTNQLVKPEDLSRTFFQYQPKDYKVPEYWDGKTAARIITILRKERLL